MLTTVAVSIAIVEVGAGRGTHLPFVERRLRSDEEGHALVTFELRREAVAWRLRGTRMCAVDKEIAGALQTTVTARIGEHTIKQRRTPRSYPLHGR